MDRFDRTENALHLPNLLEKINSHETINAVPLHAVLVQAKVKHTTLPTRSLRSANGERICQVNHFCHFSSSALQQRARF